MADARVCLTNTMPGHDWFAVKFTDRAGVADIWCENPPVNPGIITLTVSGKNLLPHIGSITVKDVGHCDHRVSCHLIGHCPPITCGIKLYCSPSIPCNQPVDCITILDCPVEIIRGTDVSGQRAVHSDVGSDVSEEQAGDRLCEHTSKPIRMMFSRIQEETGRE